MLKKKILLIAIIIFFFNTNLFAKINILATINDEIITNYDLKKEISYLEILNPKIIELNLDQKTKLAKRSYIDYIVKKKEINKSIKNENNNLPINEYLKNLYSNLNFQDELEFENFLKKQKIIDLSEIKEKIKIELLWNELIYSKYINQVKIDKEEILLLVDNMNNRQKKEYLLSEIVFKKNKNQTLNDLYNEIKISINEIGFNNSANIYSISESSKFGGKLGWLNSVELINEIKEKLTSLSVGDYTNPIKIGNNFVIIKLENERISTIKINKENEIKRLINIKIESQLNRYSKIYLDKIKLNYLINEN